jgi:(2S)-methylsuccinyl-CoA dehydrogenase
MSAMADESSSQNDSNDLIVADLIPLARSALGQVEELLTCARRALLGLVAPNGAIDNALLNRHQLAAHGFAWYATYARALEEMHGWAVRLELAGQFGPLERAILQAAFGEYLAQMAGGIALSQGEIVRPADVGIPATVAADFHTGAVATLIDRGANVSIRLHIAALVGDESDRPLFGETARGEDTLQLLAEPVRRFVEKSIAPQAHGWHLANDLIPLAVVNQLAEIGVFGITIAEEYGGLGLGKLAMCVVTEELSRGYIGVGSLGTRAEIAAELIARSGTPEQRAQWLPLIASGEVLATAVFTEPGVGSDLGALTTRAIKQGSEYHVTGNKTWITHAARSDLMIILARTDAGSRDHSGLSILLAPKARASAVAAFPDAGIEGTEIEVLGYRGMREYELGFNEFVVPAAGLLGATEGQGFKQLMSTFESARIQTAARAVGVAQNALELGLRYALDRRQFGQPIIRFPRIGGKIGWMVVETMIARQATYHAAREKDRGHRCDLEAGMAKLLAARVAWSNADNALQVHGGNGYALEYEISRVLCDARILNIFEGAAEIQAQVVARRLLTRESSGAR